MQMTKIVGAREIQANLRKHGKVAPWPLRRNLTRAGLALQRWAQEIVPIDTSNLKNSGGTDTEGHGWATKVAVFFTTAYAAFVHERTDLRHKPGKSAKYLEKPARERRGDLLKIIAGGQASEGGRPVEEAAAVYQRIGQLGG